MILAYIRIQKLVTLVKTGRYARSILKLPDFYYICFFRECILILFGWSVWTEKVGSANQADDRRVFRAQLIFSSLWNYIRQFFFQPESSVFNWPNFCKMLQFIVVGFGLSPITSVCSAWKNICICSVTGSSQSLKKTNGSELNNEMH